MKKLIKSVVPPAIMEVYKFFCKLCSKRKNVPNWHKIEGGVLTGKQIYVNSNEEAFKKMIDGSYDAFFYDYLKGKTLENKTIYDVGAHIGYHTFCFAKLVGASGSVIAFEPNPFNRGRLETICSRNPDVAQNIHVVEFAVSDKCGDIDFNFSPNIEDLTSSGGFISGSYKPRSDKEYRHADFRRCTVMTITLDEFISKQNECKYPDLIKIDVEGAEHLVLYGASELIKLKRPLLLIEIHSVVAMLKVSEYLFSLDYEFKLLEVDRASRCFVAAEPRQM